MVQKNVRAYEEFFSTESRQRGEQIQSQRKVKILESGPDRLRTRVRLGKGAQLEAEVAQGEEGVLTRCSCPWNIDADPCEHIWASLIEAEQVDSWPAFLMTSADLWRRDLQELRHRTAGIVPQRRRSRNSRRLFYVLDVETAKSEGPKIEVWARTLRKDGTVGNERRVPEIDRDGPFDLEPSDELPRALLSSVDSNYSYWKPHRSGTYDVDTRLARLLFPALLSTGRFEVRVGGEDGPQIPLVEDTGAPWHFELSVDVNEPRLLTSGEASADTPPAPPSRKRRKSKRDEEPAVAQSDQDLLELNGRFRRDDGDPSELPIDAPHVVLEDWLFVGDQLARAEFGEHWPWVHRMRSGPIEVPRSAGGDLIEELFTHEQLPTVQVPEELEFQEVQGSPAPRLRIAKAEGDQRKHPKLRAQLDYDYGVVVVQSNDPRPKVWTGEERKLLIRDQEAEKDLRDVLLTLEFSEPTNALIDGGVFDVEDLQLAPSKLAKTVETLLGLDWHVEAEGKSYRRATGCPMVVKSGVDWFDVYGGFDYDGEVVPLPKLLAAARSGANSVRLGDGSEGMLPAEWLADHGLIMDMGRAEGDCVRFQASQVSILDALIAAQSAPETDEKFEQARAAMRRFEGVPALEPLGDFEGRLRPYQKKGLGWLDFLEKLGLGGCLADDMGLGKTVQVLAHLESKRHRRQGARAEKNGEPCTSLIVVPRSVLFNWIAEARKFTPRLEVLEFVGPGRVQEAELLARYDIVLTTYGTLLRDIKFLKDLTFDYVILDEAQAIKNRRSASAKSVTLLDGRHRLALTGTPVENHAGELWSILDFLNPGMLGSSRVGKALALTEHRPHVTTDCGDDKAAKTEAREARQLVARAVRPILLRRTKGVVAKDLPDRTEQVITCTLSEAERAEYDRLRHHYRSLLMNKCAVAGMERSKLQVLEGLLRLRQAACHPGLLDKSLSGESSTKVDMLLSQLEGVLESGHKALIFSQFTKLLGIVRRQLDAQGVDYEYLDGRTRNRQAKVERFQSDPKCSLFLISLKAGGVGLNLTAAEYVFLLDPWWNPAVEAQAIDRAHRIGQQRTVFAYRLIAEETVEEKVLELQKHKRELAEDLLGGGGHLIRDMTKEDLELLLS